MPKPTQQRINAVSQRDPVSAPQESRVNASPVGSAVQASRPDGLGGLIDGLSSLQPGLQRFMAIKSNEVNAVDTQAGTVARERGDKNDQSKSAAWITGYMKMDGYVRAGEDAAAFQEAYASEFDRDNGNFEQWSRKWWGTRAKGVEQDEAFLSGYQAPMVNAVENLRAVHHKGTVEQVVSTQRTNALQIIDASFKGVTANGGVLTPEHIDAQRTALQANYSISNKEFNALAFESLLPIATAGRPQVLEALKKNRPDGTPGMYFIPEWKDKIDNAMAAGYQKAAQNEKDAQAGADRARLKTQNEATFPILLAVESGEMSPEEGTAALTSVMRQKEDLYHPDEMSEVLSRMRSGGNAVRSARQDENAKRTISDIFNGRADAHEVIRRANIGEISYRHEQELLEDIKAVEKMRQEKGEEFDADRRNRATRMRDYNLEQIMFDAMDTGPRGIMDSVNSNEMYFERQKATAMAALTRLVFASDVTDLHGLTAGARQIAASLVGERKKIAAEPDARKKQELADAMPAFQSMADLERAYKEKNISPEVRAHNIRELARSKGFDPSLPPPKAPPRPPVDTRTLQPPKDPQAAPQPAPKVAPKAPTSKAPAPAPAPAGAPAAAPAVIKPAAYKRGATPAADPAERKKLVSEIAKFKTLATNAKSTPAERDAGLREMVIRAQQLGIPDVEIEKQIRRPLSALGL